MVVDPPAGLAARLLALHGANGPIRLGANIKKEISILVAEQNVRESLRSVDRGYVLENGRIVITGSANELAHDPEVERSYLGL